jgi:hypothetical protein
MTTAELLDRAIADISVKSHAVTMLLQVTARAYADAARQRKDGSLNASPLTMALLDHGTFAMVRYTNKQITLRNISTGQQYLALMPPMLAEYLEAFQRRIPDLDFHEFELTLVSDEG